MQIVFRALLIAFCYFLSPSWAGPLLDAAKAGSGARLNEILDAGIDVHERGPQGETALHWMAFHGDAQIARRLIESGADVNGEVKTGSTALHIAAYRGHADVAKLLVAQGAKVNAETVTGVRPLDWAQRNGHREVEKLLVSNGALTGRSPTREDPVVSTGKIAPEEPLPSPIPDEILKKYRLEPAPGIAAMPDDEPGSPESRSRTPACLIQLASLGSKDRAFKAWALFRRQHPDILETRELIVDVGRLKGREVYRVQTGPMSRNQARLICAQLHDRDQPCIVIEKGPSSSAHR